jgi:hypothetical protein
MSPDSALAEFERHLFRAAVLLAAAALWTSAAAASTIAKSPAPAR